MIHPRDLDQEEQNKIKSGEGFIQEHEFADQLVINPEVSETELELQKNNAQKLLVGLVDNESFYGTVEHEDLDHSIASFLDGAILGYETSDLAHQLYHRANAVEVTFTNLSLLNIIGSIVNKRKAMRVKTKSTEKDLKSYQSLLVQLLSTMFEKNKSTPFNLSVEQGKSMFAERDMVIAAVYASDMIHHTAYTDDKVEEYLTNRVNHYYNTDINKENVFPDRNHRPNTPESALALLAQIMFIAEPTYSKILTDDLSKVKSLFIAGYEGAYDWSEWTTCLEHDEFEQGREFSTFADDRVSTDSGWTEEEIEELNNSPLFSMLPSYSAFSHTIVKII